MSGEDDTGRESVTSQTESDIELHAAGGECVTVRVPATFSVDADLAAACDVEVAGWLEGTVNVSTPAGSIRVGTVRGLLTSLDTGRGDVRVEHIEGNLDLRTGGGAVELGKILGEEVRAVVRGGALRCEAVYAKSLDVEAAGGVAASVLSAESGTLRVGGDTTLDSVEGSLRVESGGGDVVVQASDHLHAITVDRHPPPPDAPPPSVAVHLPAGMVAHAHLLGETVTLDERLEPRELPASPAITEPPVAGATRAELGSEADALAMGTGRVCALTVRAAGCDTSVIVQNWLEQRLKRFEEASAAKGRERAR